MLARPQAVADLICQAAGGTASFGLNQKHVA
jgi:hypothetical protein